MPEKVTVILDRDEARALVGEYDEVECDINCGIPTPGEEEPFGCTCGVQRHEDWLLGQAEGKVQAALALAAAEKGTEDG